MAFKPTFGSQPAATAKAGLFRQEQSALETQAKTELITLEE